MATFYWNSGKKENIIAQWVDHLQHEAYVKDVNQIIEKNSQEISEAVKTGSVEQVQAINNVCGKLEDMNFNLQSIDYNISELRGEINAMASMLDWKLSQMIEEQRITNQLLGFIAQLLRIPDSQKQRVYHIEQGIKYLKNAFMENDVNSSFYIDALEDLKKAENIERKDFITLNRIGQVHLYSKSHLDFAKAEEYFLKSARESFAEANVNGTTVSNNLSAYGYKTDVYSSNPFIVATAESYLYAGRACYLQNKLDEASEYAKKAFELIPEFLQAGFEQAKYLASNDKRTESVKLLENVISSDRLFSVKTVKDGDLISKNETTELLNRLKIDSYNQAKEKLNKLKSEASKSSNASEILSKIESHLSKNNYLSNMKALDMINSKYQLPYYENRHNGSMRYNDMAILRITVKPQLELSEFLKKENNSHRELNYLKDNLKQKLIKEEIMNFGKLGAGLGAVIGFFRGCTMKSFSMDSSTWLTTTIVVTIIGIGIGYLIANSTNIKIKNR
jgi:tetratricopeptide (TPR) repeat protein